MGQLKNGRTNFLSCSHRGAWMRLTLHMIDTADSRAGIVRPFVLHTWEFACLEFFGRSPSSSAVGHRDRRTLAVRTWINLLPLPYSSRASGSRIAFVESAGAILKRLAALVFVAESLPPAWLAPENPLLAWAEPRHIAGSLYIPLCHTRIEMLDQRVAVARRQLQAMASGTDRTCCQLHVALI